MNFFIRNICFIIMCTLLVACTKNETKKIIVKFDPNSKVSTYNDWYLYKGHNACYIASYPISSSGNYTERDANYIIISYNPISKKREFSITGGLKYDNKANTTIEIDGNSYMLINNDYRAWTINEDEKIIKELSKNPPVLVVFNFFENNIHAIDKYSTNGLQQALDIFKNECNTRDFNSIK